MEFSFLLSDLHNPALGTLIEQAVEHELIEFCYVARQIVVISLGTHQLSYPHDEARAFLRTLVQGWQRTRAPGSRTPAPGDATAPEMPAALAAHQKTTRPERPAPERPAPERPAPERPAEASAPARPAPKTPEPPAPAAPPKPPAAEAPTPTTAGKRVVITSSEEYVDAVLAFAEEMNLIEGFDKDQSAGKVTLHTNATKADMTYFETLEYLTGSILDELRAQRREPSWPLKDRPGAKR